MWRDMASFWDVVPTTSTSGVVTGGVLSVFLSFFVLQFEIYFLVVWFFRNFPICGNIWTTENKTHIFEDIYKQ